MHLTWRAKAAFMAMALGLIVSVASFFVSAEDESWERVYLPLVVREDDRPLIAFNSEGDGYFRDIHVMRADGTGQRHLVSLGTEIYFNAQAPAWSPDGSKIAYESFDDFDIHIINVDGTGRFRLTHNDGIDRVPTWSPGGTRIAFTSSHNLYVIGADGSGQVRLTDEGLIGGGAWSPSWSPDGTRIAFSSSNDIS